MKLLIKGVVLLYFIGSTTLNAAFAEDLDKVNEKIKNKYLYSPPKVDLSNTGKLQDNYYKNKGELWEKTRDSLKRHEKELGKKLKNDFNQKELIKKGEKEGRKTVELFQKDKKMKKLISDYTKDIYMKHMPETFWKNKKKDINKFSKIFVGSSSFLEKDNNFIDGAVYIFLSASVPKSTWKTYVKTLREIGSNNIYLVLRGCIGKDGCKYFMPTYNFIKSVSFSDNSAGDTTKPANVIIDPILYKRFSIKVVPSIVYTKKDYTKRQFREELSSEDENYWKMEGDVSLAFFFERLKRKGVKSEGINKIIEELNGF